jgi:hypothetical protein
MILNLVARPGSSCSAGDLVAGGFDLCGAGLRPRSQPSGRPESA